MPFIPISCQSHLLISGYIDHVVRPFGPRASLDLCGAEEINTAEKLFAYGSYQKRAIPIFALLS